MENPNDKLAENLASGFDKLDGKRRLREELKARFDNHRHDSSQRPVNQIREYLRENPRVQVVATFAALPGEVDLRDLCGLEGRVWVYPKVVGSEMVFRRVEAYEEDMVIGKFGIREPRDGTVEYDVQEVDLFLCPGLGFDTAGGRLGRGKGFYDRALARARVDAMKLGVCFTWQMVDKIIMEDHDVKMNAVIAG